MSEKPAQTRRSAPGRRAIVSDGRIGAVFKADQAEASEAYSVSEWRLEPNTRARVR